MLKGKEVVGSPPRLLASAKGKEIVDSSTFSRRHNNITNKACTLQELPAGNMGKMLVYKSGAIKLKLGDILYNVSHIFSLLLRRTKIFSLMINSSSQFKDITLP